MTAEEMPAHAPYLPVPYEHRWRSPDEQLSASHDVLATMARRRTVRDFAPTPVPFELIENAIRTAALAPSGANQQPWTFVVISDPGLKRRLREAAEAQVALATDLVRVAEARQSAGEAGDLDLLAARVELARARRAVTSAEASVAAADAALRIALGLDPSQSLAVAGALDDARARYARSDLPAVPELRADLHAAELALTATRAEVALEARRALPVPMLQLSYQREEGADVYLAGLSLPLPLFQRNQGPAAEARARLGLLTAERDFVRQRVETEVAAARSRLAAAREGLRLLEEDALPNLGATMRLVQRAYELGQADLTRVLVVRQQAAETRREHLDALLEVALAGTALDAARGVFR